MKCGRTRCPIQTNTFEDCKLTAEECPNFTPEINYEVMYENMCNHIADLVVKKLKESKDFDL